MVGPVEEEDIARTSKRKRNEAWQQYAEEVEKEAVDAEPSKPGKKKRRIRQ